MCWCNLTFTLHASVVGWGLFDASMCFPKVVFEFQSKGDFIGQCICVYLHNMI